MSNAIAEIQINCVDFSENLNFFTEDIGFSIELIFPADSPRTAILSGHGLRIRLEKNQVDGPISLNLINDESGAKEGLTKVAPNGSKISFVSDELECEENIEVPSLINEVVIKKLKESSDWIDGRAGMQYRDLVPNRLGGRFIASNIRIEKGGPVPDYVHYHHITFQMIYCYKGWVKAVYEDQGEAFIMNEGDCVLQPPHIRHQVLECSDNFEVIEVGSPAEHKTLVDHDMSLPTKEIRPNRDFGGQKFILHKKNSPENIPLLIRQDGFQVRDTKISEATAGLASVVALTKSDQSLQTNLTHNYDVLFFFVLWGRINIHIDEKQTTLDQGDSISIPANTEYTWKDPSDDLEILEISLPPQN